jgi:hypothetical protein
METPAMMKNAFLFLLVSISACQAQPLESTGEFPIYNNGLIYDEHTMGRLSYIVDSLNLKFKSCDPKTFLGFSQGRATYVELNIENGAARKAMDAGMPLKEFLQRFSKAKKEDDEWIYSYKITADDTREVTTYKPMVQTDNFRQTIQTRDRFVQGQRWVYQEDDGKLSAYYLHEFSLPKLPAPYARLIQYVDCMIDTTAEVYLTKAREQVYREVDPASAIGKFLTIANNHKGKPAEPRWDSEDEKNVERYYVAMEKWNNDRIASLDQKMKWVPNQNLLKDALEEALGKQTGSAELEFYVARYLSEEEALQLKRLRRPVGMCSQDRSPRLHAVEICKLAAKTSKWDIFLRAHLDIMNDNFSRASDGSYAWAARGTYLKELEELNIDVLDLIIGTSLRSENVSNNHYFADIGRVGRALSDTRDPRELETRLVKMISDPELDIFNRLVMAYVFSNYNYHLTDTIRQSQNKTILKIAVSSLPEKLAKNFKAD